MKDWQNQSNMAEMAVASLKRTATGLACCALVRDTHAPVEGAVRDDGPIIVEVKELSVGHLHYALTDNIIVGSGVTHATLGSHSVNSEFLGGRNLQNTKLQFVNDLGHPVDDLGLSQIDLRTFGRLHRSYEERIMTSSNDSIGSFVRSGRNNDQSEEIKVTALDRTQRKKYNQ